MALPSWLCVRWVKTAVTPEFWEKLAAQGWLGLLYPEEFGGSGLGMVDLVVLLEEMGRAVMPGPYFSTQPNSRSCTSGVGRGTL